MVIKTEFKNLEKYGIEFPKWIQLSNGGFAGGAFIDFDLNANCRHLKF